MIAPRRTRVASDPLAVEHDQCVIDLLEASFVAELRKPAIDRAPRRQVARQQAPGAARAHHVEDAVDDLAHRPAPRPSGGTCRRQVRLDHAPFLIGHVGLVSVRLAIMLLAGGWGPHGNSGVGLATPWNHVRPQPFKHFRNGLFGLRTENRIARVVTSRLAVLADANAKKKTPPFPAGLKS